VTVSQQCKPPPPTGERYDHQAKHGRKAEILAQAKLSATVIIKFHLAHPLAVRIEPDKAEAIL
jgi:hypothetical protein